MLPKDFLDFFECLESHHVEYLIVGAYAMGAWGYVRATGDLDIFVNATDSNAKRVMKALREFGAPMEGLTQKDLSEPGTVFQMGLPPLRIDLRTEIDGVTFDEARAACTLLPLIGRDLPILSLQHLIKNKKSTRRPRDIADLAELEKIAESSKNE